MPANPFIDPIENLLRHIRRGPWEPWRLKAACRGMDPDFFHPRFRADHGDPLSVCHRCPVSEQCHEHAVEYEERFGVWGAEPEKERRVEIAARNKQKREEKLRARDPQSA